jgi:hypothetical protein
MSKFLRPQKSSVVFPFVNVMDAFGKEIIADFPDVIPEVIAYHEQSKITFNVRNKYALDSRTAIFVLTEVGGCYDMFSVVASYRSPNPISTQGEFEFTLLNFMNAQGPIVIRFIELAQTLSQNYCRGTIGHLNADDFFTRTPRDKRINLSNEALDTFISAPAGEMEFTLEADPMYGIDANDANISDYKIANINGFMLRISNYRKLHELTYRANYECIEQSGVSVQTITA